MKDQIKLNHPFVNKCPNIDEFFKRKNDDQVVNSIESMCYMIKKLSAKYAGSYDENLFKGDCDLR